MIAIAVLLGLFVFLGFRLTGIGSSSWVVSGVILGSILLYPLVWNAKLPDRIDKIIRGCTYFAMGLLGLLLAQLLVRDILFIPLSYLNPNLAVGAFSNTATLSMMGVAVLFLVIGYWKALQGPQIVKVEIPIPSLPAGLENFLIAQISDLHAGPGIDHTYVENIVNQVLSLNADIVVLTGDIADGDFDKYHHRVAPLARLSEKTPALYVTGNHEFIHDSEKWIGHFKKIGMNVLMNQHTLISNEKGSILFAGVTDPAGRNIHPQGGPNVELSLKGSPTSDIKILLAHQPDIADRASAFFDLQLSGHTHAGQFFPWNYAIKLFQRYDRGLKKSGPMWVYTNIGTGYWGPPLRLGTTSEITLIQLIKG